MKKKYVHMTGYCTATVKGTAKVISDKFELLQELPLDDEVTFEFDESALWLDASEKVAVTIYVDIPVVGLPNDLR